METGVFLKKEWIENIKNRKLLIVLILTLLFGFMGPIMAKITPDIMSMAIDSKIADLMPTPTVVDSWLQFYKNVGQMLLILFVIMFGDILSREISQSTLVPLITKGLKKSSVLKAKSIFLMGTWSISILLAAVITHFYNYLIFDEFGKIISIMPMIDVCLFGLLVISALICGSVLLKGYGNLLLVVLTIGGSFLLAIPTATKGWSPINLMSQNAEKMFQAKLATEWQSYMLTMVLIVVLLLTSRYVFNRKLLS